MVTTRHLTIEEFETMPLEGRWELIDGEPVEMAPASDEPSSTAAAIGGLLYLHVRAGKLGRVYSADGGFALFPDRDTILVPDAAFVTAERAPQGEARKKFPRLPPDLAVEVLSPSDRIAEALAKVAVYLEAGVRLVWLVDPAAQTVTVFRPDDTPLRLGADDVLDGGAVLPGFSVSISEIFE